MKNAVNRIPKISLALAMVSMLVFAGGAYASVQYQTDARATMVWVDGENHVARINLSTFSSGHTCSGAEMDGRFQFSTNTATGKQLLSQVLVSRIQNQPLVISYLPANCSAAGLGKVATVVTAAIDNDSDGMPDDWELQYGLDPFDSSDAVDDIDQEGLANLEEYRGCVPGSTVWGVGSSPLDDDTDGDGVYDQQECQWDTNPNAADTDGDGLSDYDEAYLFGSVYQPQTKDTDADGIDDDKEDYDGDGLTNIWEQSHGTDPVVDENVGTADWDSDGLINLKESNGCVVGSTVWGVGSDPYDADTDDDGVDDESECRWDTNPNAADTDGDTLTDWQEAYLFSSVYQPQIKDTDSDGIDDGKEDYDLDGMANDKELYYGFDPTDPADGPQDFDSDGIPNVWEVNHGLNPKFNDSLADVEMPTGDGLTNIHEYACPTSLFWGAGSDPWKVDTDNDGLADTTECAWGLDPNAADTDGDGLSDFDEAYLFGSVYSPDTEDTDNDLLDDGAEDCDGDGKANKWEMDNGLSPVINEAVGCLWLVGGVCHFEYPSHMPCDLDWDNDGLLDAEDPFPTNPDGDGDGIPDGDDPFPADPGETHDTDGDGIGNNADLDDDNDRWSDVEEASIATDPLNYLDPPRIKAGGDMLCSLDDPDLALLTNDGNANLRCWDSVYGTPLFGSDVEPILLPNPVNDFAVGYGYICALLDGVLQCVDLDGADTQNDLAAAGIQSPLDNVTDGMALSAAQTHACVISGTRGVVCWGDNVYGEATAPTLVDASEIATGLHHSCALASGGVYCWGDNTAGQAPVQASVLGGQLVSGYSPLSIVTGDNHSCAIVQSGSTKAVNCWGDNTYTQVSGIPSLLNPDMLVAGGNNACVIDDGGVLCWGDNSSGQNNVPTYLLNPVVGIATGADSSCALQTTFNQVSQALVCWPLDWGDADGDSQGNAIDTDDDNDSVLDVTDNCPLVSNVDQSNIDADAFGDVCDPD